MTVCIAAICNQNGNLGDDSRIVCCTDWLASGALGKSQTALKTRWLGSSGFRCLTAGTDTEIATVAALFKSALREAKEIDETNVAEIFRGALQLRRRTKVEEFVQGRYSIPYQDLVSYGKEKFPPDLHREAMVEVAKIRVDASFILAGFLNKRFPILIETDDRCRVVIKERFAVVGAGQYLAGASMLQREHGEMNSLETTIYAVFEAKKNAERESSVGEQTSITVLYPNAEEKIVSGDGFDALDARYKKYGIQNLPKTFGFPNTLLESL